MKNKSIKTIVFLLSSLLVLFLLLFMLLIFYITYPIKPPAPEEGVWYSDTMQMQLSFEYDTESFVTINGKKMICLCINNRNSKRITLLSQDENWREQYSMGRLVFAADVLRFDDEVLLLIDDNNCEYSFNRVQ